jgi:hypothetical protein
MLQGGIPALEEVSIAGIETEVEDPSRRVRGLGMRPRSRGRVEGRLRHPRSENLERVVEAVRAIEVTSLQRGQKPVVDIGEVEEDDREGKKGGSPPPPHHPALRSQFQIEGGNHEGGSVLVYQIS